MDSYKHDQEFRIIFYTVVDLLCLFLFIFLYHFCFIHHLMSVVVFKTKLLTQYVLQLAKYDQNYDIRDRARFIRHLIMPSGDVGSGQIHKHAKKILLSPKPAPVLESPFKGK